VSAYGGDWDGDSILMPIPMPIPCRFPENWELRTPNWALANCRLISGTSNAYARMRPRKKRNANRELRNWIWQSGGLKMGQGSEDAAKDDDRAGNPNPGHQWRQSTIVLGNCEAPRG